MLFTQKLQASTGLLGGVLTHVGPGNARGKGLPSETYIASLSFDSRFIHYRSNTKHLAHEHVDKYQLTRYSTAAIEGWLTSLENFHRALPHLVGQLATVYEDKHFDFSLTPEFEFGRLRNFDGEVMTIDVIQTPIRFHYGENPILEKEILIAPDADFRAEGWKPLSRQEALRRIGRWTQIHPPRGQTIWAENPETQYNPTYLKTIHDNHERGPGNGHSNNAVFHRYAPAFYSNTNQYRFGMLITTWADPGLRTNLSR